MPDDPLTTPGGDDVGEARLDVVGDPAEVSSSYGVGFEGEDADDVSPPEMHEGHLPVGFEIDSLVPHLGTGADDGPDPEPAPLFQFGLMGHDDHDASLDHDLDDHEKPDIVDHLHDWLGLDLDL